MIAHTPAELHSVLEQVANQAAGRWDGCLDMRGERIMVAEVKRLQDVNADMLAALQALVADILEYERINNLAPNPGKQDCWQSVTRARATIAKAERS